MNIKHIILIACIVPSLLNAAPQNVEDTRILKFNDTQLLGYVRQNLAAGKELKAVGPNAQAAQQKINAAQQQIIGIAHQQISGLQGGAVAPSTSTGADWQRKYEQLAAELAALKSGKANTADIQRKSTELNQLGAAHGLAPIGTERPEEVEAETALAPEEPGSKAEAQKIEKPAIILVDKAEATLNADKNPSQEQKNKSDQSIVEALKKISNEVFIGKTTVDGLSLSVKALEQITPKSPLDAYILFMKDQLASNAGLQSGFKNHAALAAFIGANTKEMGSLDTLINEKLTLPAEANAMQQSLLSLSNNDYSNFKRIVADLNALIANLFFSKDLMNSQDVKRYIETIAANILVSQRPALRAAELGYAQTEASDIQAFGMMLTFIQDVPKTELTPAQASEILRTLRDRINLLRINPQFLKYNGLLGMAARTKAQETGLANAYLNPLLETLLEPKKLNIFALFANALTVQLLFDSDTFISISKPEDAIPDYMPTLSRIFDAATPQRSLADRIEESIMSAYEIWQNATKSPDKKTKDQGPSNAFASLKKLPKILEDTIAKIKDTSVKSTLEASLKALRQQFEIADPQSDAVSTTLNALSFDKDLHKQQLSEDSNKKLLLLINTISNAHKEKVATKGPIIALLEAIKTAYTAEKNSATKDKRKIKPIDIVVKTQLDALNTITTENTTKILNTWSSAERNATQIPTLFSSKTMRIDDVYAVIPKKDWYDITNSYGVVMQALNQIANEAKVKLGVDRMINSLEAIATGNIIKKQEEYAGIINDQTISPLIKTGIYIDPNTPLDAMITTLKAYDTVPFVDLLKQFIKTANDAIDVELIPFNNKYLNPIARYLILSNMAEIAQSIAELSKGSLMNPAYAIDKIPLANRTEKTTNDKVYGLVGSLFADLQTMLPHPDTKNITDDTAQDIITAINITSLQAAITKTITATETALNNADDALFKIPLTKPIAIKAFRDALNALMARLTKLKAAESIFGAATSGEIPPPPPPPGFGAIPPPPPPPPPMPPKK